MNKKILVTILGAAFAIAMYWLGFGIGAYCYSNAEMIDETETVMLSDEEIMQAVILEEHGTEYYGVLCDDDNDEFIDCLIYSNDGKLKYRSSFNREYYQNRYTLLTNN